MCTVEKAETTYSIDIFYQSTTSLWTTYKAIDRSFPGLGLYFIWFFFHKYWGNETNIGKLDDKTIIYLKMSNN